MLFPILPKNLTKLGFIALSVFSTFFISTAPALANITVERNAALGVIKGVVRDGDGNPIKDAVVAIFHVGTSNLLKQVRSGSDGSFLAKILPGTYTVLAVAEGFNSTTVSEVRINPSTEINYGFKLERAGSGNTLPEKRIDRNSSKWRVRAAQSRRSVYQATEGEIPVDENKVAEQTNAQQDVEAAVSLSDEERETIKLQGQSVVETYFASSDEGSFQGFNFATLQPIGENTEIIIAAQTGTGKNAPTRIETTLKNRLNENHLIRLTGSFSKVGTIKETKKQLGQISFQALDEWQVRDGVILVLGFDYSRFVGAGNASALTPRLGIQFDADSKTRLHAAYTGQNEERTWMRAIELEDSAVFFREPLAAQSVAVEDAKPLINRSRRMEFGIERVLDNSSNIEATAFFDSVAGRGVGLLNLPVGVLNTDNFAPFTVEQQGRTQGARIVYHRRFGKVFSAAAGYAFGRGQKISSDGFLNSADVFENAFFQTFAGQVNADLKTGTQIKTIFRLSPQATIFAIDPFQGRLAIFDPSLSIIVTQPLPRLGLPIRAEAVLDARNILDYQSGANNEQGSLRLSSQGRSLRGGISVRF